MHARSNEALKWRETEREEKQESGILRSLNECVRGSNRDQRLLEMIKNMGPRLGELKLASRGSQDVKFHNLGPTYLPIRVDFTSLVQPSSWRNVNETF